MIAICMSCESREANCKGACICTIDGRDIKEHVADRQCPRNLFNATGPVVPAPRAPSTAKPCCGKKLLNGAIGLAKVVAQSVGIPVDVAGRKVEAKRLRICTGCDQNEGGICKRCDCIIAAKVRLASEKCPEQRW